MPPKVGDTVFAKTFDVYTEEAAVRPGIVTKVFTEDDGEFAKDREIVSLVLFGGPKVVEVIDMDKASVNDDGEWGPGGWSDNENGPSSVASDATTVSPSTPGPLGSPAARPDATSGATTGTVGDGSDTAPRTQPV